VPAYASVLVPFDPLRIDVAAVTERLYALLRDDDASAAGARPGRTVELPTRYGGDAGPDLAEVAERAGLTAADVVDLHASVPYRVYMLGFAPGFAYLGRVPAPITVPRRAVPRPRVPAGSVGIAGEQTGVYPFASPGGWQLIGRTDAVLWDVDRHLPALLQAGDTVRFVPTGR
jgi:inhibitor of KinA